MIRFLPLGGADEIGANCYYLNIDGTGILLDSGIHPRKMGADALPNFDLLENQPLDFVLISHAHQDHIGSLPYLVKLYPHVIIYSTPQTKEIAELALHNSSSILRKKVPASNPLKPYSHDEIDLMVKSFREYDYEETFSIIGMRHTCNREINITFYDAGHILGSAGILIEYDGTKIFYTGDINLSSQEILAGASLPTNPVDILITETTYAGTDSRLLNSWRDEAKRMAVKATKVLSRNGSVLIPVFALGKTQEILLAIYNLMIAGKLTDTSIYCGGISKKFSRRYDVNRYKVTRNHVEMELGKIPVLDLFDGEIISAVRKNPSIVLASSGMMIEGTKSFQLVREWLKFENNAVFIVGYMDPETPGYQVLNGKKGTEIFLTENGQPVKVKCDIEKFYFPSHSKREDLLQIVEKLKPSRVVLVHGDTAGISWMGSQILQNYPNLKVHSSEPGHEITFL